MLASGVHDPVVECAARVFLHDPQDLCLAPEAVCLERGNGLRRPRQHIAMGRTYVTDAMRATGRAKPVKRIKVGIHLAIRRIDHGRAAIGAPSMGALIWMPPG